MLTALLVRGARGALLLGLALLLGAVEAPPTRPRIPLLQPHPSEADAPAALTAGLPAAPASPLPPPRPRVSVNRATQAELEALPGIGPALAQRIIAGRPYQHAAELDRVRGIGPKTLKRLSDRLSP